MKEGGSGLGLLPVMLLGLILVQLLLGVQPALALSLEEKERLYEQIDEAHDMKQIREIPGLEELLLEEKPFSVQEVARMVEELQADRKNFFQKNSFTISPLDQLISAFKEEVILKEKKNLELLPQIRFQWVRTRDWIFLSTITINPIPHDERKPAVLVRTPYGPTTSNLADLYLLDGYVAVLQDQRGAFLSTGQWDFWRKDSEDAYDTMEWIAKQKWSNGKVYTAGISADGCSALTQWLEKPSWLSGQFLVWASGEAHDTAYQGGAYRQSLLNRWLTAIGITTRLHSWTVIDDVLAHESKDEYWATLSLRDNNVYPDIQKPAVFWVGWYDIFQGPNIEAFNGYQMNAASSAAGKSILYVDPGGHCVFLGDANYPRSFTFFPFRLSRDMFNSLETGVPHNHTHSLYLYVMGTAFKSSQTEKDVGNYWTALPDWPKKMLTPFYFNLGGRLTSSLPTEAGTSASYLFEPRSPIKTPGGANLAPPCGVHDLRSVESRSDVLVFTSDILSQPVAVVGQLQVVLYVSSSAIDTDFTAFLSDVNPDNSSALVQDGIFRMRWRESKVTPVYMQQGKVYQITVDLWYVAQVFNAGHRIRVTVSSSNSPRFSVNRNNGKMVEDEGEYIDAINTIHFSPEHPSHLLLPVVNVEDLPVFEDINDYVL